MLNYITPVLIALALHFSAGTPTAPVFESADPPVLFSCLDCDKRIGPDCGICDNLNTAIVFKGIRFQEVYGTRKKDVLIRYPFSISYSLTKLTVKSAFGEEYSFKVTQASGYSNVHDIIAAMCACFAVDVTPGDFSCEAALGCSYIAPQRAGDTWYWIQYDTTNTPIDTTSVNPIPHVFVSPELHAGVDTTGYRLDWIDGYDGVQTYLLRIPDHVYDDRSVSWSETDTSFTILTCTTPSPERTRECDTITISKYSISCTDIWDHITIIPEANGDSIYYKAYCNGVIQDTTAVVPRKARELPNPCEAFLECFSFDTICVTNEQIILDTMVSCTLEERFDTIISPLDTTIVCDTVLTLCDTVPFPIDTIINCDDIAEPDSCDFTAFWCCNTINRFRFSDDQGSTWTELAPPLGTNGWANASQLGGLPPGYIAYRDATQGLCEQIEVMALALSPMNRIYECLVTENPFGVSVAGRINCNADLWIDARYDVTANCDDCYAPGVGAWYEFMRFDSTRPFYRIETICDTTILYDTLFVGCDTTITCDTTISGGDTTFVPLPDTLICDTTIVSDTITTGDGCWIVLVDSTGMPKDTIAWLPSGGGGGGFTTCEQVRACLSVDTVWQDGAELVFVEAIQGDTIRLNLNTMLISDAAWSTAWDGDTAAATKNAIYDGVWRDVSHGIYSNDADAAANGCPINQNYTLNNVNTYGLPAGTIKRRVN